MHNKKDLILLHGALGSKKQFDQLMPMLEENYNLYSFDLPSHGVLAKQRDSFSMYNFSNFLHQFVLKYKLTKPSIFGFSMGGYVALTLQSQTDIFDKIMTLNSKFEWDLETAEKEKTKFDPDIILDKVPHYADYLIKQHGEDNWRHLLAEHRNLMFKIAKSSPLNYKSLSKIKVPVLVCRGSDDNMVTFNECERICKQLQNATYYEFANTQHPIEKIDKALLSNKIIEFFG